MSVNYKMKRKVDYIPGTNIKMVPETFIMIKFTYEHSNAFLKSYLELSKKQFDELSDEQITLLKKVHESVKDFHKTFPKPIVYKI